VFAVRSAIWFVVAKIAAGLNAIDAAAAQGLRFIGAKLRDLALAVGGGVGHVVVLAVGTVRSLALSAWAFVVAGLASLGAWLKSGASRLSARLHRVVPSVGHFLTVSFGGIGARVRDAWRTIGSALGVGLARLSARAGRVAHGIAEAGRPVLASVSAKAHALAPSLVDACGRAGHAAGNYAKAGALRLKSLLPAKAPPVGDENAVSSPRAGGFELSQMLIIAGTILLVCGGLMLGGGLLLRAGTPSSAVATASPAEPIAWLFEHKTLRIDERSVFAYTTTAEGVRIKGFAIGGVNLSDHSVSSLGGVIKPDHKPREIALTLSVEMPGEGAAQQAEVTGSIDDGTVPSQAPFRLVFLFPESGDGGMTPREVLDAYGGLMLKVRYDVNGTQRSFIQYLPQALLEEQLAEIAAEAKGS
jgi:hypothetical protein